MLVVGREIRHLWVEVAMDHSAPSSIMIVGDDSHFCYLLRSYIRRSAHQARFSYPGDGVVETIQQEKPALIVLDVDLPGMSGWNLLRALKAHPNTHAIPVMICSWLDEKERGAQEGANICLRMPILYGDFINALNSVGVMCNADGE
jgi:CheY-like chemotaxis protein